MSSIAHPAWKQARGLWARIPLPELLVGLSLCIAACLSIHFTRVPGGIALFWPASAIAATLMIRMARVRWLSAALAITAAMVVANVLFARRSWPLAAVFAALNGLEIALMVVAFRRVWRYPYPSLSVEQAAVMTAVLGVAIPGCTAAVGALFLHMQGHAPWTATWLQWWSSHTIGACLLGPPIILFSLKELKRLTRRRYLIENAIVFALGCTGCYLAIRYVRFPFVSIGFLLMVAAFRLGGFGTSLLSLGFGLLITNLWLMGIRPIGLDPVALRQGSLVGLPVLALLATVMPPIAVGLGSDARRASGRALRVSERRFRESMAHSPIGMLISDLEGHWLFSNLALQKMLGYSAEEFQAMPPGGPSTSDDWQESGSRWRRLIRGEIDSYEVPRRFKHREGHWVWTHVAVSLLRDEDGAPLHLIAQIESLEARRLAEDKLVAERERLRITLEAIGDAVVTTDAGSRITYVNAAAQALLGLAGSAGVGRRVDEVIHLVDPETSKTAVNLIGQSSYHARALRREQPCLMHRPDGSICHVLDIVTPVMDGGGAVSGFVIVFRDASAEVARGRDLQYRALHDPLTGLSNRADFGAQLRAAFTKAKHLDRDGGLIAIDLDRFKAVNDTAGHAAGDAVLCKVAEVCREAVRSSDTVARLGGDEFAIILENCNADRARRIAEQLLQSLNPLTVEHAGVSHLIYASLGLAMTDADFLDEKAWLDAADQACLAAKRAGRSQLRVAEPR
jgi:diguanylate cyclase